MTHPSGSNQFIVHVPCGNQDIGRNYFIEMYAARLTSCPDNGSECFVFTPFQNDLMPASKILRNTTII